MVREEDMKEEGSKKKERTDGCRGKRKERRIEMTK